MVDLKQCDVCYGFYDTNRDTLKRIEPVVNRVELPGDRNYNVCPKCGNMIALILTGAMEMDQLMHGGKHEQTEYIDKN